MKSRLFILTLVTLSFTALAATGCGLYETKAHYGELPPVPSPDGPIACPAIGRMPPPSKDLKPQTETLNLARTRVEDNTLIYVSDAEWIRVYDGRTQSFVGKIKQESANVQMILADDILIVLGKSNVSVFKTNGTSMPEKVGSTGLSGEFMSARVIADRVIVVSAKNILTTQKPIYVDAHPHPCNDGYTFVNEEKFYETQITSVAIQDLEDSMSVKLLGFVSAKIEGSVLSIVESLKAPKQDGTTIIRIMNVLPDGRLGELQTLESEESESVNPPVVTAKNAR